MKTKLNSTLLGLAISATLALFSCKNETESVSLIANPSTAGFNALRSEALGKITEKKTFKAEDGLDFTTSKGTRVQIFPNCLRDNANNTVSGDVTLSFVEMYDRGNMTVTNKPLMGLDGSGNLLPLITGGQYNIAVHKGDQVLKSGCIFYVDVPAALTGGIDPEMKLWKGNIDEEGNLEWEEQKREGQNGQGKDAGMNINTESATYSIWGNEFGWTNVDRFYNDPRPKTQIKVTVPSAYNNQNSAVYIAYEGESHLLAQLDTYDTVEHFFSEHYGFIPVGLNIHVIFVSESNGSVAYTIKKATVVQNGIINIVDTELQTSSLDHVKNLINNLN